MAPGDKAIAGFADPSLIEGPIGARGIPGASVFVVGSFPLEQHIPTDIEFGAALVNPLFLGLALRGQLSLHFPLDSSL